MQSFGGFETSLKLGLEFTVSVGGVITALQYYRVGDDAGDTYTRTLTLWESDGDFVISIPLVSGAGAVGWQFANLPAPVPVVSGETYVVSYSWINDGDDFYGATTNLSPGVTGPQFPAVSSPDAYLTAPVDNGLFSSAPTGGAGTFPTTISLTQANYFVDVTFVECFLGIPDRYSIR